MSEQQRVLSSFSLATRFSLGKEDKADRGRGGKTTSGKWTGLELGKSQRAVENRGKWRKLVAKSSVVPQRSSRLRDRWWWWWWCFIVVCSDCIALYFIILHSIALYNIALHWAVLCCTAVYHIALYCITLHCVVLHFMALYCNQSSLHWIILHSNVLECQVCVEPFFFFFLRCILLSIVSRQTLGTFAACRRRVHGKHTGSCLFQCMSKIFCHSCFKGAMHYAAQSVVPAQ